MLFDIVFFFFFFTWVLFNLKKFLSPAHVRMWDDNTDSLFEY